jgi:hypothetical protein
MSCYISSGISLGCSDGVGSLKTLYIVGGTGSFTGYSASNVDGSITGITASTGTTLYTFQIKRQTSALVQNITKSYEQGSIFFEQVLTAVFYKYDQLKRNQVKILSQNDDLQIIVEDQNGVLYLLGQENGMYLSGGNAGTGTAFADLNGFSLEFKGQEKQPANVISGTLSALATAGGWTLAPVA